MTDGLFERMLAAREHALAGDYRPGIIAPILPINGYGHMRVLERYRLVEEYTKRFERSHIAANPLSCVEESVEAAKFLWGKAALCHASMRWHAILGLILWLSFHVP